MKFQSASETSCALLCEVDIRVTSMQNHFIRPNTKMTKIHPNQVGLLVLEDDEVL